MTTDPFPFLSDTPTDQQVGELDEIAGILDEFALQGNHLAEQLVPLYAHASPRYQQLLIQRFLAEKASLADLFTQYVTAWQKTPPR